MMQGLLFGGVVLLLDRRWNVDRGSLATRAALRIVAPSFSAPMAMLKLTQAHTKLRCILCFEAVMIEKVLRGSARCAHRDGDSGLRIELKKYCFN